MGFARPDFRKFKGISGVTVVPDDHFQHSAKGSTWEEHKYIKRVDGTYYYPDSYEGGRHLSDGDSGDDKKSQFGEYDKNDSDFKLLDSDKAARIGDTDFFAVQREDGTWVIGEEDMKWVLPKGVDPTKGDFAKNLGEFEENVTKLRESGEASGSKYTNENWRQWATEAIDKASGAKVDDSRKISDEDVNNLAKEVIKGNFGNGQQRKDLLGENYAEVQAKVNELMKSVGSQKVSSSSTKSDPSVQEQVKAALNGVKDNRIKVAAEAWNNATKKK